MSVKAVFLLLMFRIKLIWLKMMKIPLLSSFSRFSGWRSHGRTAKASKFVHVSALLRDITRTPWPGAICPQGSEKSAPQAGRTSQPHSHSAGLFQRAYFAPPFFFFAVLRLKSSKPKFCLSLMKPKKLDWLKQNSWRGNYEALRGLCSEINN